LTHAAKSHLRESIRGPNTPTGSASGTPKRQEGRMFSSTEGKPKAQRQRSGNATSRAAAASAGSRAKSGGLNTVNDSPINTYGSESVDRDQVIKLVCIFFSFDAVTIISIHCSVMTNISTVRQIMDLYLQLLQQMIM